MQKTKKKAIFRRTIALLIAFFMFSTPTLNFLGEGALAVYASEGETVFVLDMFDENEGDNLLDDDQSTDDYFDDDTSFDEKVLDYEEISDEDEIDEEELDEELLEECFHEEECLCDLGVGILQAFNFMPFGWGYTLFLNAETDSNWKVHNSYAIDLELEDEKIWLKNIHNLKNNWANHPSADDVGIWGYEIGFSFAPGTTSGLCSFETAFNAGKPNWLDNVHTVYYNPANTDNLYVETKVYDTPAFAWADFGGYANFAVSSQCDTDDPAIKIEYIRFLDKNGDPYIDEPEFGVIPDTSGGNNGGGTPYWKIDNFAGITFTGDGDQYFAGNRGVQRIDKDGSSWVINEGKLEFTASDEYQGIALMVGNDAGGNDYYWGGSAGFNPIPGNEYRIEVVATGTGKLSLKPNDNNALRETKSLSGSPLTVSKTWVQGDATSGGNLIIDNDDSTTGFIILSIVIYETADNSGSGSGDTPYWKIADFTGITFTGDGDQYFAGNRGVQRIDKDGSSWAINEGKLDFTANDEYQGIALMVGNDAGGNDYYWGGSAGFNPIPDNEYRIEVVATGSGKMSIKPNNSNGLRETKNLSSTPLTISKTWIQGDEDTGGNLIIDNADSITGFVIHSIVIYETKDNSGSGGGADPGPIDHGSLIYSMHDDLGWADFPATATAVLSKSDNPTLTKVGEDIHVTNRNGDWFGINIALKELDLKAGYDYTFIVTGKIDAGKNMKLAQSEEDYQTIKMARAAANGTFDLTTNKIPYADLLLEMNAGQNFRIQTDGAGTVPFEIHTIEVYEKIASGYSGVDPIDPSRYLLHINAFSASQGGTFTKDLENNKGTLAYGPSGHANVYIRANMPTAPAGFPNLDSITLTYQGPDREPEEGHILGGNLRILAALPNQAGGSHIGDDALIDSMTVGQISITGATSTPKTVTIPIDREKLASLVNVTRLVIYAHSNSGVTLIYSDISLQYIIDCCSGDPSDCNPCECIGYCKFIAEDECCYVYLPPIQTNEADCILLDIEDMKLVGATENNGQITITAVRERNMIYFDVDIPNDNTIYDYGGFSFTQKGISGDNRYKTLPLFAGEPKTPEGLAADYPRIAASVGNGFSSDNGVGNASLKFTFNDLALRDLYDKNLSTVRIATSYPSEISNASGPTVFELNKVKLVSKSCDNDCDACYVPPLPGENFIVSATHPDAYAPVRVAVERYGYDYELWSQYGAGVAILNVPPADMQTGKGGIFNGSWDSTHNVLIRAGKKFAHGDGTSVENRSVLAHSAREITDIEIDYDADWQTSDGAAYLAVYGWAFFRPESIPTHREENEGEAAFSNEIEYYIVQDRGGYNPVDNDNIRATMKGSKEIDGVMYGFYVTDRLGQPMLNSDEGNFKQYWSMPLSSSGHRTSGIISVSEHFAAWEECGMIMDGPLYEVAMKVESYTGNNRNSSGFISITKNLLSYDAPPIPKPSTSSPSPSPSPSPAPPVVNVPPTPSPNYGTSSGASDSWKKVEDVINNELDTGNLSSGAVNNASGNGFDHVISTGSEIVVPAQIFDTLQGTTGTLMMDTGSGVTFSISGGNIPEGFDMEKVDLSLRDSGLNAPPAKVAQVKAGTITSIDIPMVSNDSFGMVIGQHFNVGTENAGNFANLYRFNEVTGEFDYLGSYEINDKGQAMFGIAGGGDYVLTVSVNKPNLPIVSVIFEDAFYTVVRGDNLARIAHRYGMTLPQIRALNPEIRNPGQIRIGQKIRVR